MFYDSERLGYACAFIVGAYALSCNGVCASCAKRDDCRLTSATAPCCSVINLVHHVGIRSHSRDRDVCSSIDRATIGRESRYVNRNVDHFFVELTEQDAVSTSKTAIENLQKLKDRGYHLLIDDFGMGHTSIRYLQYDIFDTIKLDGSITQHISEDQEEKNRVIISNITDLSTKFNLSVVAEYVETREQKEKLSMLGVDYFQGYYISKPLNAVDYNRFLDSWSGQSMVSA